MKVMANSIPKGGTHLLFRLISLAGFEENPFWIGADLIRGRFELLRRVTRGGFARERITIGSEVPVEIGVNWLRRRLDKLPDGAVFGAHCLYSQPIRRLLAASDVSVVCMLRDPRSIAVSHLDYIKRTPRHFFHPFFMALGDDNERLKMSILGGQLGPYTLRSLADRYREYLDWKESGSALMVRFEDLVGEKGGGCADRQRIAIKETLGFLGHGEDAALAAHVQASIFGSTSTFRKGRIDSWRSELPPQHLAMLNDSLGPLLPEMGYEE
ncbi:sulfotransferase domain-containing protein [Thiorhodovibrio frisius]|uniref:Sulfotransferase family protein n=1 Tax=Thiorhodovibrio frisius TaxID=631362 RepID=H8YYD0_9GAMM|nr:sulfotransferase domain-containing protein [Thiorhodovibrio frisius]EIC23456.1 sulfotransferase family protein [Thiorhodovibrio frisius]WPL23461.1 Sulfotransferase domain protein [Thiorhodovibrio frisius]